MLFRLFRRDHATLVNAYAADPELVREDRLLAVNLKQYEVLANIIIAIFNEFWQTNAFFTGLASVAMVTSFTSWPKIAAAPMSWHVGVLAIFLVLMAIWETSLLRHVRLLNLYIEHAVDLEARVPGLDIYGLRVGMHTRLPSVRRLWVFVPLLFSVIPVAQLISRIMTILVK